MVHKVGRQCFETVGVAEDGTHVQVGPFARFDGVLTGPIFGTLGVIIFDFLQLAVVEQHFGGTPFIDDAHGDFVGDRFGHGVRIDDLAEDVQGGVDGRAGEADVGGVGQRIVQIFGKAVGAFDAIFGDAHFLVEVDLAAVRFVGDADDVAAFGEQLRVFGEFVDGGEEDATAAAPFEQGAQFGTAFYADHGVIANVCLWHW